MLGVLPPGAVERIRLRPLSLAAVAALSGRRGNDAEELLTLTGGNPLFVTEVTAAGDATVPTSVRHAVMAQFAQLSGPARDLIEFVAIVPGRVEWTLLADLVDPDGADLREGVQRGLLDVTDEGVGLRHELQRRTVEDSLTPDDRQRRHRLVLTALGASADPARLVHHARGANDVQALLAHAPRAGRAAMDLHSHREARAHFRAVGRLLDRLPVADAADIADDWARVAFHIDAAEAADVVQRAAELWRRADDPRALSRTLAFGAFPLAISGRRAQARRWAVELADGGRWEPELAYALTEQARVCNADGADDEASDALRRAIDIAERIDDARTAVSAHILDGMVRSRRGDRTGAEIIERARRRAAAGGHRFEEADALMALSVVAARRGRVDADEAVRAMWEAATGMGLAYVVEAAGAILAEHLWLTDARHDDRLGVLDRAVVRRVTGLNAWMGDDLVFWMWKLGRVTAVPPDLLGGFRSIIDGDAYGAADFWSERRMPYHHAVALMQGDDDDAVRAVHLFEDLGADAAARRLRALLRERGVTVGRGRARSSREHVAGLTARQAEVLNLLADGLSNAEIADHLFISERTVENHVAAILRKLDAPARDEAVAAARTRGLLDEG